MEIAKNLYRPAKMAQKVWSDRRTSFSRLSSTALIHPRYALFFTITRNLTLPAR